MVDSDLDPSASEPHATPEQLKPPADLFMQGPARLARWIAVLPMVLVIVVHLYQLYSDGFDNRFKVYGVPEGVLPVALIGVLLFLRSLRWHALGQGMYLGLALLIGSIAAIRAFRLFQFGEQMALPLWFMYNTALVVGYSIGGVLIWRSSVRELQRIAAGNPTSFDPAEPWAQPAGAAFDTAVKTQRLRLIRLRLWALAAPFCYLTLLPGLQLLGNSYFLNWNFMLPLTLEAFLLTGCGIGLFSRRPAWRVLAAGACVYFCLIFAFLLGRDWNSGDPWLFDTALGWGLSFNSWVGVAQTLFYGLMITIALVSFWMALRLQKQELDILPGQAAAIANAAADAREDDLDDDTSWDQSGPR